MNGYKTCPKCGAEHKIKITTCGCGYTWGQQNALPARDPMAGCCAYSSGTARCHYPGVFSDSLKGDGQFYCREHEFNKDPMEAERILMKSHDDVPSPDYSDKGIRRSSEIRFLKKMHESPKRATQFNPAKPGKDWAKRILERQEQGEKLPIIAIDMAKEALKERV